MKINPNIFREYDIRGKYPQEIDEKTAYALGFAFVEFIKAKKVVVGRDARPESENVFWAFIAGASKAGTRVSSLGICSTPELFFAVGAKKFSGGCMVTASHSPAGQTGFKTCDSRGRSFGMSNDLGKIAKLAAKVKVDSLNNLQGEIEFISVSSEYKKFIKSIIEFKKLSGLKVVLDASSGSGARLAEEVFADLPIYSRRMNFHAGDKYPDHGPNPMLPESHVSAIKEVKKFKADVGIIFDGDADRAIFIDEQGRFVEPYYVNCLLARIILGKKKKQKLVVDARLGLGISETISKLGGTAVVHRSGYTNIIRTMESKKIIFGCENSGHFMFSFSWAKGGSNYVYSEAILPVLLVLEYLRVKKINLSEAVAEFRNNFPISGEINIKTRDFNKLKTRIKQEFAAEKFAEIDGLSATASSGEWFFNIRPSHTEPLVRLNVEAKDKVGVAKLKAKLISIINPK